MHSRHRDRFAVHGPQHHLPIGGGDVGEQFPTRVGVRHTAERLDEEGVEPANDQLGILVGGESRFADALPQGRRARRGGTASPRGHLGARAGGFIPRLTESRCSRGCSAHGGKVGLSRRKRRRRFLGQGRRQPVDQQHRIPHLQRRTDHPAAVRRRQQQLISRPRRGTQGGEFGGEAHRVLAVHPARNGAKAVGRRVQVNVHAFEGGLLAARISTDLLARRTGTDCVSVDRAWPGPACGRPCPRRPGRPASRGSSPARCVSAPARPARATSWLCDPARFR